MRTGRPRKPTALHVLEGTERKDRRNPAEPQYREGASPPSWLSAPAKKRWAEVAPLLEESHVLTAGDAEALGHLCEAQVLFERARRDRDGNLQLKAMHAVEKWLVHFGKTPASRAKVAAVGGGERDPFEEFLSGRSSAAG